MSKHGMLTEKNLIMKWPKKGAAVKCFTIIATMSQPMELDCLLQLSNCEAFAGLHRPSSDLDLADFVETHPPHSGNGSSQSSSLASL